MVYLVQVLEFISPVKTWRSPHSLPLHLFLRHQNGDPFFTSATPSATAAAGPTTPRTAASRTTSLRSRPPQPPWSRLHKQGCTLHNVRSLETISRASWTKEACSRGRRAMTDPNCVPGVLECSRHSVIVVSLHLSQQWTFPNKSRIKFHNVYGFCCFLLVFSGDFLF